MTNAAVVPATTKATGRPKVGSRVLWVTGNAGVMASWTGKVLTREGDTVTVALEGYEGTEWAGKIITLSNRCFEVLPNRTASPVSTEGRDNA